MSIIESSITTVSQGESLNTAFPMWINTTTKADLFSRAKNAIEAGDQSLNKAAEALALACRDFNATQREIAEAVGKSAAWVNRLLRWRTEGCLGSPFGPSSRAVRERKKRVQSTEQRAHRGGDADRPVVQIEKSKATNGGVADPNSLAGGVALTDFTARVLDLITRTDKQPPKHFSGAAVATEDLTKLGQFLIDLANYKVSETVKLKKVPAFLGMAPL